MTGAPPWDMRRRDSWPAPIRCFLRGGRRGTTPEVEPDDRSGQTHQGGENLVEGLAIEGGATEHEKVHERAHGRTRPGLGNIGLDM